MPQIANDRQIEQVPISEVAGGLAQPVAIIGLEPHELTERYGIQFEESKDDLDYLVAALIRPPSGRVFALVRHRHQPNSGTDILINEKSADMKRDLEEAVRHLGLTRSQLKWLHPTVKRLAFVEKRLPNIAFMRPVFPDAYLSAIVGSKPLPRSELTKKLWDYIKKNGLQDKKKRTLINADDNLKPVFNGKSQVSMFEMTKLVSGHLR
jgi:upstream activation factor subunit UAF30